MVCPDSALERGSRASTEEASLSLRELAHELNSLLDGSIRSLSLALRGLLERSDSADDQVARQLRAAEGALADMSQLLGRALDESADASDDALPLRAVIERLVEQLAASASTCGVDVVTEIAPEAATICAGRLVVLLRNGLRNAIEAAASGASSKQVEILADVGPRGQLTILISDTGPGVHRTDPEREHKTAGHGIGLWLSERLARELGGDLQLVNVPFGSGAVWKLCLPVEQLSR